MVTPSDIVLKKISELEEMVETQFTNSFVALTNGLETYRLELEQLRQDVLNNATLTGICSVDTPNPGDNSQRITNTEWVQDELAGLGLNPATQDDYGTVRTNSTDSVPTVYLTQEIDAFLTTIASLNSTQSSDITSLDGRLDVYDALNIENRLNTAESDINSIEGVNTTQGANITTLLNNSGILYALWTGASAPSGSNQFITGGTRSLDTFTIPGFTSAALGSNTIITIQVAGSYILEAIVNTTFNGSVAERGNVFLVSIAQNVSGSWNQLEYGGINLTNGALDAAATIIQGIQSAKIPVMNVAAGTQFRVMLITNSTGSAGWSVNTVRFWARRIS